MPTITESDSPVLLHLDTSPLESSITRELTREFVKTWKARHPNGKVIYRDLSAHAPKPIDAAWVGSAFTPVAARTPEQRAELALSEELIAELEQADEYVLGVAMHNFSIPSVLKLWIDQVVRSGRTFAYGENGPKGLLQGKKATVAVATGGVYEVGTPAGALNFVEPYLKSVLGFIGVTDVQFVTAGGAAQLLRGTVDRAAFLQPVLEKVREVAA
ncbi:MAG TPA: NAD(P)H-dependent oxidoreductase [Edaphobacter sp.]|nr:NAD(P)H-dependent oxidoreductase [Edaphobacter sp.]